MATSTSQTSFLIDEIRNYLKKRRTCSMQNLSEIFNTPFDTLASLIQAMEISSYVRIAQSSCSGSCSSCETCGPKSFDPSTIIISLEKREDNNDCYKC